MIKTDCNIPSLADLPLWRRTEDYCLKWEFSTILVTVLHCLAPSFLVQVLQVLGMLFCSTSLDKQRVTKIFLNFKLVGHKLYEEGEIVLNRNILLIKRRQDILFDFSYNKFFKLKIFMIDLNKFFEDGVY